MELAATIDGGRVHLRRAACGTIVAELNPWQINEPASPGADYVSPTPPDTDASVDVGAIRQPHHFDLCYRTAKRARKAAEADPGNDPTEALGLDPTVSETDDGTGGIHETRG